MYIPANQPQRYYSSLRDGCSREALLQSATQSSDRHHTSSCGAAVVAESTIECMIHAACCARRDAPPTHPASTELRVIYDLCDKCHKTVDHDHRMLEIEHSDLRYLYEKVCFRFS